jgi:hypothetical protein
LVAASLVMLLLFGTGPLGPVSLAQQPTPSATASTAYKINFLNPSGYSEGDEDEISSKDDNTGADDDPSNDEKAETYHVVAWVNQLPPDSRVEFLYREQGENRDVLIGEGETSASPDTFEFDWDPNDNLKDGPITLKALLYSGSTIVAQDVETDNTLNDGDPPQDQNQNFPEGQDAEDQGATIELTYPENGAKLGWSKPRDQGATAVLRVSFLNFGPPDATFIRAYYTATPVGSEPEWTLCGDEYYFDAAERIVCSLASKNEPEQVTGVAVIANDSPEDEGLFGCCEDFTFDDSGDAHRVLPYRQVGTTVTVTPEKTTDVAKSKCTQFTVEVKDQEGQPMHRANVDIHMVGPDDKLSFDDPDSNPCCEHKAPDQGHRKEEAVDCETLTRVAPPPLTEPTFNGFQGETDVRDGPDIKHLETTGGTSTIGQFVWRIYSFNEGTTQLTAWSDDDNDDEFCTNEASDSASIGWRDPAPDVVGVPATVTDCPIPTPTQGSPSPQPTGSGEPSPEPTTDPRSCTIVGDDSDNTLNGTSGDDVICGFGGNDIIRGKGGSDLIYGDAGSDEIRGGGGNDAAKGGGGKDVIRGAGGNDILEGGKRNDTLSGGSGRDKLSGNAGFDILKGGDGRDSLMGGSGDDILKGALANDSLDGAGGKDILSGDKGRDRCRGGPGKDRTHSCET